jgi:hypothetical protein
MKRPLWHPHGHPALIGAPTSSVRRPGGGGGPRPLEPRGGSRLQGSLGWVGGVPEQAAAAVLAAGARRRALVRAPSCCNGAAERARPRECRRGNAPRSGPATGTRGSRALPQRPGCAAQRRPPSGGAELLQQELARGGAAACSRPAAHRRHGGPVRPPVVGAAAGRRHEAAQTTGGRTGRPRKSCSARGGAACSCY